LEVKRPQGEPMAVMLAVTQVLPRDSAQINPAGPPDDTPRRAKSLWIFHCRSILSPWISLGLGDQPAAL
jgi:hypothetical protein